MIPQLDFITERLVDTDLKASLIDEPITGIRLLMANLAVFMLKVSAPCEIIPFAVNTNMKTDIINNVMPVKAFLIILVLICSIFR